MRFFRSCASAKNRPSFGRISDAAGCTNQSMAREETHMAPPKTAAVDTLFVGGSVRGPRRR